MSLVRTSYNNNPIDPRIISGLVQSDGSFSVSIIKSSSVLGFVLKPRFSITLKMESLALLKAVHIYFGVGNNYIDGNYVNYQVSSFDELWHVIIPHFISYPLHGSKHVAFLKFVTILTYLYPYQSKIKPHSVLANVLALMVNMNAGSSRNSVTKWLSTLNTEPDSNIPLVTDYLRPLLVIDPYFLVGLIEGDGSFYFGIRKSGKLRFGFSITTHYGELDLMYAVKRYLGFGNIKKEKTWCRFETESVNHLYNVMMPLVDGIPMLGSKRDKYLTFRKVLIMYKNKEHLTVEGQKVIKQTPYDVSDTYI